MDLPDDLLVALAALSDAISDDGTDLAAILAVLRDDLVAAVPSYLGLRLTVISDGNRTVIDAREPTAPIGAGAGASVRVPLGTVTGAVDDDIVFYAAAPHAFDDLAGDARRLFGLDGQVQVDHHLDGFDSTDDSLSVRGLEQQSTINQAIGVLIDRGHTPQQASDELARRAQSDGHSLHRSAQLVLSELPPRAAP